MTTHAHVPASRVPLLLLAVWMATATLIGATGALSRSPIPPPLIAFVLAAVLLALIWFSPAVAGYAGQVSTRSLVAFQLVRAPIGVYFLVLWQQGVLPGAFAIGAGWGDIVVGGLAAFALWKWLPVGRPAQVRGLILWNALGLVDIVAVLANAMRLFAQDPAIATPFVSLPLALLPLFVVPLVIASHVVLFTRLVHPGVVAA